MPLATRIQEIQYNATKLIYTLAGDDKNNYDSLKGTEVFEFFRLLWVHEDLMGERIKRLEKEKQDATT